MTIITPPPSSQDSFERRTIKLLQEKLIEISEADFTLKAVCPLFDALGYDVVDYHGGNYEGGKDVICWKDGEFDDPELTVIQVKKYKYDARASSERSFSEVVTQLSQAVEKKVQNSNGKSYYPNRIYFITPYDIDTRSLEMRFEEYKSLRDHNKVQPLSGTSFIKKLVKKYPTIVQALLGEGHGIKEAVFNEIGNEDLLHALNYQDSVNVEEMYCDLEFVFGGVQDVFFNSSFEGKCGQVSIPREKWLDYKNDLNTLSHIVKYTFLQENTNGIESNFKKLQRDSIDTQKQLASIQNNIEKLAQVIGGLCTKIMIDVKAQKQNLRDEAPLLNIDYDLLLSDLEGTLLACSDEVSAIAKFKVRLLNLVSRISEEEKEFFHKAHDWTAVYEVVQKADELYEMVNEMKKIEGTCKSISYQVPINGAIISNYLNETKTNILDGILSINKSEGRVELSDLLRDIDNASRASKILFKNWNHSNILSFKSCSKATTRMKISVHDIFKSGVDLLVLGDAGAGKTTSLQVFAKKQNASKNDSNITFYLPLAKIFGHKNNCTEDSSLKTFLSKVASYYKTANINISSAELSEHLTRNNCTVLFDGVDEVVKKNSGLIKIVDRFKNKYPKTNIILSSRIESYTKDLDYLGIYLLPFTEGQRNYFIQSWFSKKDVDRSQLIIEHIENNETLSQLVRSPLLTTILCVLAESDTPLPVNEIELYSDRMRLLLGQYDRHKGIRRVESSYTVLKYVARKAAYILHNIERRQLDKKALKSALYSLKSKYPNNQISLALDELIEPCNVLVPMTADGKVGFGHLRYQEYLASCELSENRSMGVGKLLQNRWWRGALVMFSMAADDISYLESWIANHGHVADVIETYNAMIDVRPESDRKALRDGIASLLYNAYSDSNDRKSTYEDLIDPYDNF
jgi:hypothetical protein